jgi:hypothetical protein
MPPLTKAHGEDPRGGSTGFNGEEDTTDALGEEDPGTTAPVGEEDATFDELDDNPFGSF